eukprot:358152-Chlamydomonas_euryale.AAC.7
MLGTGGAGHRASVNVPHMWNIHACVDTPSALRHHRRVCSAQKTLPEILEGTGSLPSRLCGRPACRKF